jgi:hypothetical protein
MKRLLLLFVAICSWPTSSIAQEASKSKADLVAADDSAVLEVVFQDLLTWPDSPFRPQKVDDNKLLFSPEAPARRLEAAELHNLMDAKPWPTLSPVQRGFAQEAEGDLLRRHEIKDSFKGFKPKNDKVTLWDKTRADAEPKRYAISSRHQVFSAYAPGYSRDRQLTIVHVTFPRSIHGGIGNYVLAKKDGKWVVLVRNFCYFL